MSKKGLSTLKSIFLFDIEKPLHLSQLAHAQSWAKATLDNYQELPKPKFKRSRRAI